MSDTVEIPLVGSVSCGLPIFAEENIEAQIPVSTKLIRKSNNYFLLRAFGDSMNKKGINGGDLLLIKQQQVAENKDLVLALVDDDATVKEFIDNGDTIVLKPHSTNPKHQPIILTNDFRIQGIVEKVIKI
nr:transcriptional repressor LexA [Maribacter sp.]